MKQVLHILTKDVRHLWMEILASLAALAAYSWHEVYTWKQDTFLSARDLWVVVLTLLVPLTWWFLIIRLIQAETLVGDRQFWITRPYEWKKLLAGKAIFVVLFITVPCYVAGIFLLIEAGFNPIHYLAGLLWMQLYLILLPLLPMMALATVTRNVTQALLALVALILYMIGMGFLDGMESRSSLPSRFDSDWFQGAVLVAASVLVIVLQYVRRKTALSRALLAGSAGLIALIVVVTPYLEGGETLFPIPASGSRDFLRVALEAEKGSSEKQAAHGNEPVVIIVPLSLSGLPENSFASLNGVKLRLQAADGFQWSSNWESYYGFLLPQENHLRQEFKLEHKAFERLKSASLTAMFSLAVTLYRENAEEQVTASSGDFLIPRIGFCSIDAQVSNSVRCRSPLQKPPVMLIRTELAASTCPAPGDEKQTPMPGVMAYDFQRGDDSGPEYGIDRFSLSDFT